MAENRARERLEKAKRTVQNPEPSEREMGRHDVLRTAVIDELMLAIEELIDRVEELEQAP